MNEFVEACRREWRRLRVPDAAANEMAADLEADLEEAQAEGASAEAVLGSGAFDPRSFANAWAAERGLIGKVPRTHRFAWTPAVIAALALIAITGAILMIRDSHSGPTSRILAVSSLAPFAETRERRVWVAAEGDVQRIVAPVSSIDPMGSNASGVDSDTVGSVLVFVALGGIVLLTLFWSWAAYARRRRELA